MKRESASMEREIAWWNLDGASIIGVDEVGRGCLAGPVVAGAVVFDWANIAPILDLAEHFPIRDSKTLSRKQRQETAQAIRTVALAVSVAEVDAPTIDAINILQATLRAMGHAVRKLPLLPEALDEPESGEESGAGGWCAKSESNRKVFIYVDGNQPIPLLDLPQETVINGDATVFSIAAASIVAKEYRDSLMERFDETYPGYNFSSHKGYGTKAHTAAIRALGLTPIHRNTFWHG